MDRGEQKSGVQIYRNSMYTRLSDHDGITTGLITRLFIACTCMNKGSNERDTTYSLII